MSLDVYLEGPDRVVTCTCECCDNEHTRVTRDQFYWANITHNLTGMADAAGIYGALWRPDEHGITTARQVAEVLRTGIKLMKAHRERFERFDSPNGWGTYERFVPWCQKYLAACDEHPDATVRVSR